MPFHCTTALESKPAPLTVSVNTGPPATTKVGLSELITGEMVKVALFEVAPLSTTVTAAVPAVAIRVEPTVAVNCVAFQVNIFSALPFHCTAALESKPVPFTVSVKAAPPAFAELGLSEVMTGEMVKVTPFEVPMSLDTVTVTVPAVTIRLESTWAVSCVAVPGVVGRVVAPQCTVSVPSKFEPVTVSVKLGPPAVAELGLIELIDGVCPEEFAGAAKSTATAKHTTAIKS